MYTTSRVMPDDYDNPEFDSITPGSVLPTVAYVSSFIDKRGRVRYVKNCSHSRTAPDIVTMDGLLPESIECECDKNSDSFMEWGCDCRASYFDAVDYLERQGYIHLSIVSCDGLHSFNLYTRKAPTQAQMDTLYDYWSVARDSVKQLVADTIDELLVQFGKEKMFAVSAW